MTESKHKTQEILNKIQIFNNKAMKYLNEGDNTKASFYFSLISSLYSKLSDDFNVDIEQR